MKIIILNEKQWALKQFYSIFLGSLLITVNVIFGIFVFYPSDLSPNLALALFTLPVAFFELKEVFTGKVTGLVKEKKQ